MDTEFKNQVPDHPGEFAAWQLEGIMVICSLAPRLTGARMRLALEAHTGKDQH